MHDSAKQKVLCCPWGHAPLYTRCKCCLAQGVWAAWEVNHALSPCVTAHLDAVRVAWPFAAYPMPAYSSDCLNQPRRNRYSPVKFCLEQSTTPLEFTQIPADGKQTSSLIVTS